MSLQRHFELPVLLGRRRAKLSPTGLPGPSISDDCRDHLVVRLHHAPGHLSDHLGHNPINSSHGVLPVSNV